MLRLIQDQLQAVYRVDAPDVRAFLVDESALADLLGDDVRKADEWVLVRESEDGVDLAVYVADAHLASLERTEGLDGAIDGCFPALCAAVEGVSHFLYLVERARRSEPVSMLELEVQAEVDKFVCAALRFPERQREWQFRLFRDVELAQGLTVEERDRYREAGRLAAAYCASLERVPHLAALFAQLREFWRDSGSRRLDHLRRLAAA